MVLSVAVVGTVTEVLCAAVIATILLVPYTLADSQLQKLGHVRVKHCIAVDGVCAGNNFHFYRSTKHARIRDAINEHRNVS